MSSTPLLLVPQFYLSSSVSVNKTRVLFSGFPGRLGDGDRKPIVLAQLTTFSQDLTDSGIQLEERVLFGNPYSSGKYVLMIECLGRGEG